METKKLKSGAIMAAYLAGGIAGVRDLADRHGGLDERQIKRAIASLEKRGAPTVDLEHWLYNTYNAYYRLQSRMPVEVGDVRVYRAFSQSGPSKTPYVKVPINTLGVYSGGSVRVLFRDDHIVLQPINEETPADGEGF